jgi:assimilatory nitrate reductase catalytic subunit
MGETRTTCPYCGTGCGLIAATGADCGVQLRGDPEHPANFGRLCSKGAALGETLGGAGRLLYPQIGGRRASWDEALDVVAERFSQAVAEHGPDSVAFYVSGQCLTEDYYVANKLMKGFIGSANIDTNSRLCMASTVAGHKRAFGADVVPGTYEDLELADLVVLVGSNLAWCHPVIFQRLAAARQARPDMRIVVIDPRRTATCEIADLHLAIRADGDLALFNGLLAWLADHGPVDDEFIARHCDGFAEALVAAGPADIAAIAAATGLAPGDVAAFYSLFAAAEKAVTAFSQGVNQSAIGSDKVNAIINCHLATGRIGRPGTGPFSLTGQPNAMGGREVGGLANMLAAHMEIEDASARAMVRDFWRAPHIAEKPGLKAVELFQAVGEGRIKALWIMATNPADSMPEAARVAEALAACPFVVVSDCFAGTDTAALADVLLPAAGWGEKSGTVTNSERRISRQRSFLPPPGEARPDWWALAQLGQRLGYKEQFAYSSPAEIFREHAALSGLANDGARAFDISGLAGLSDAEYDVLSPVQWPSPKNAGVLANGRMFADAEFATADGKARFVVTPPRRESEPRRDFRLILNSGRVRDHWHTMTRTARSPRLSAHIAEPFVEIHPSDAAAARIGSADLVRLSAGGAQVILRALVTERQRRNNLFVPMHWSSQFSSSARVNGLFGCSRDPLSGQPALKRGQVTMSRFPAAWHGFAICRDRPDDIATDYWALAPLRGGFRLELASLDPPDDWNAFAEMLLGGTGGGNLDWLSSHDRATGSYRFAAFDGDRLAGVLYVSRQPVEVSRAWVSGELDTRFCNGAARLRLLAGRPGGHGADPGAIVCSCFGVGANQIAAAIQKGHRSVEAVGQALGAGTNCGSCRAEVARLVEAHVPRELAVPA